MVGKHANTQGAPIVTHTNDCADCDFRVGFVPSKEHAPGSKRDIPNGAWSQYPRSISNRSSIYRMNPENFSPFVQKQVKPIATIPEVRKTFALFDANYPIINEHGLVMGESTCSAKLQGLSVALGGSCLFTAGVLMSVAMERCTTAREAILLMGSLAQQ